jgi:DNA mismatch repair protein MutL
MAEQPFSPTRGSLKPVQKLPTEVARKIAAGEVIDRPNAILRELLDNAVDSGADSIIAEIEGGGINSIRVVDNGVGMTKEDLLTCAQPHATSKITSEIDLENLSTMGFRGEALASIGAVCRLGITSTRENQGAWHLETYLESNRIITPAVLAKGTIVQAKGLFENFPARRQFLKRPASETNLCKQTFVEKAIPFPNISFRFVVDNKIRFDFPKNQSLIQRVVQALELPESEQLFYEVSISDSQNEIPDWHIKVILGSSAVSRPDRKNMYIYVNGRRIQEYGLLQAIDYGATGYFPNGTHPVCCVFIEISPHLVDFNIHPAKKEVRFKDIGPIHHGVNSVIRNFYQDETISSLSKESLSFEDTTEELPYLREDTFSPSEKNISSAYHHQDARSGFFTKTSAQIHRMNEYVPDIKFNNSNTRNSPSFTQKEILSKIASPAQEYNPTLTPEIAEKNEKSVSSDFTYIGPALGVFLVVEKNDGLYLVDQHAGHERILYNAFLENAGQKQFLLVPLVIETETKSDDEYLECLQHDLEKAGFDIVNHGQGTWEVTSVPIKWEGTERDLQADLLEKRASPEELIRRIAARTACRSAIKDGNIIDRSTAETLLTQIFALPEPRCPHGRPIWTKITKEELFGKVER